MIAVIIIAVVVIMFAVLVGPSVYIEDYWRSNGRDV